MVSKKINSISIAENRVIIIGAGIAGLSLAIQLTEKKLPCVILEGRKDFLLRQVV